MLKWTNVILFIIAILILFLLGPDFKGCVRRYIIDEVIIPSIGLK